MKRIAIAIALLILFFLAAETARDRWINLTAKDIDVELFCRQGKPRLVCFCFEQYGRKCPADVTASFDTREAFSSHGHRDL